MKKLSIIIPVMNHLPYTKNIYEDIRNKSFYYPWKSEIIFINNASTDWTQEYLEHIKKSYENIIIINNSINVWVTKAWNQWIEQANWEYVLVLNNDIYLPQHIDKNLIQNYKWRVICPLTRNWFEWENFKQRSNINWTCWLIKKTDYIEKMDERLTIWYSDDFLFHRYWCDWVKDWVVHIWSVTLNSIPSINEIINEDRKVWIEICKYKKWEDKRFPETFINND